MAGKSQPVSLLNRLEQAINQSMAASQMSGNTEVLIIGLSIRRENGQPWSYHRRAPEIPGLEAARVESLARRWSLNSTQDSFDVVPLERDVLASQDSPLSLYLMTTRTDAAEIPLISTWCVTRYPSRTGLSPLAIRAASDRARFVIRRQFLKMSPALAMAEACKVQHLLEALRILVADARVDAGILWSFNDTTARYTSVAKVNVPTVRGSNRSYSVPITTAQSPTQRSGIVAQVRPEIPLVRYDRESRSAWLPPWNGPWGPRDEETFRAANWRSCIAWPIAGLGYLVGAVTLYSRGPAVDMRVPALRPLFDSSVQGVLRSFEHSRKLDEAEEAFNQELARSAVSLNAVGHIHDISGSIREISQSLQSAQGYTTIRPIPIEPISSAVNRASESATFVSNLSDHLRRLAIETEWGDTVFDARKVLSDLVPFLAQQCNHRSGARFTFEEPAWGLNASARVRGNPLKFERVIFNIVDNASIWTRGSRDPAIKLRLEPGYPRDGQRVIVRIEDNGAGIAEEDAGRIFDRFFTRRKHEGSGLGLYLAREFVRGMRGSISVASTLGEGSTFTISIPVEE